MDKTLIVSFLWFLSIISASEDQQEVRPGQDAPLRCRAPRGASIRLLEWSRTDLKERGYVFFYRNQRSYENYQLPSFRGRVELRDPEMKDGDVSVILKNVTAEDAGRYECRVLISTHNLTTSTQTKHLIELTVTDSAGNIWTSGFMDGYVTVLCSAIGGFFILSIICIICFVIFCKRKDTGKENHGSDSQDERGQSTRPPDLESV